MENELDFYIDENGSKVFILKEYDPQDDAEQ
ncbi:hypothetical protein H3018_gp28 [Bacillus phage DK3]|uniref:Uncharacterized protein n=2 Tax=Hemphillvirus TaxID=2842725 RepID=A0A3T0IJ37_9CAUD|nr:hypothetical protein H3017_gp26 [Bacillus phage DK2]YP_009910518.1 hypothetical protein H3018_gp28 [Bacillus phage DK3]AZU99779.1 hypothetical protein DK2_000026 [Bacillus phage DK2]AZU99826.1 hypothetical protein DK3_000028 [Bacillus phage DK3]